MSVWMRFLDKLTQNIWGGAFAMIDRKKYDNLIETLEKIAQHHTDHDLHGTIAKICALRDGFEFKLWVVGPYNAGKSSLLNGLIDAWIF